MCVNGVVVSDSLQPHGLYLVRLFVHSIFQARILEWVAISFSKGIFLTPGIEPRSPEFQADSLPSELPSELFIHLKKKKRIFLQIAEDLI